MRGRASTPYDPEVGFLGAEAVATPPKATIRALRTDVMAATANPTYRAAMGIDLAFWKTATEPNPRRIMDRFATQGEDDDLSDVFEADPQVLAFRIEATRRWPILADMVSPWRIEDGGDRYAYFYLSSSIDSSIFSDLPALAHTHGLHAYDPQSEAFI